MDTKTVLNVGCGTCPIHPQFEGWVEVRLDIDPAVKPDIIGDIRYAFCNHQRKLKESNEAFDAVYSSHNLEHLHYYEVPDVLSEFHRILKPGGLCLVGVPDLQAVAVEVAKGNLHGILYESPAGPIAAIDCIYGYRKFTKDNPHQMHKTGFTPASLEDKLIYAGFRNTKVECQGFNMWASGVKQ